MRQFVTHDPTTQSLAVGNPNTVKVDITISETVLFSVEQKEILRAYEEFNGIPKGRAVAVYSLNEIAIEKVVALGDRARNEPRDLYDLWFLIAHAGVELHPLIPAIEEKLLFRNKEIAGLQDRIVAKEISTQCRGVCGRTLFILAPTASHL